MFGIRFPFCARACASISMITGLSPHRIFLFLGYGRNYEKVIEEIIWDGGVKQTGAKEAWQGEYEQRI